MTETNGAPIRTKCFTNPSTIGELYLKANRETTGECPQTPKDGTACARSITAVPNPIRNVTDTFISSSNATLQKIRYDIIAGTEIAEGKAAKAAIDLLK